MVEYPDDELEEEEEEKPTKTITEFMSKEEQSLFNLWSQQEGARVFLNAIARYRVNKKDLYHRYPCNPDHNNMIFGMLEQLVEVQSWFEFD